MMLRFFATTAALLALAGCQTGGGEGAVAETDGKSGRCVAEAGKLYDVAAGEVAISAEYPFGGSGSAIDGSVNKAAGGIKLFRCEFDAAGTFQRVVESKDGR